MEGRREGRKERRKEGRKAGRQANWIGHSLCMNCLLKQFTKGKIDRSIEVTGGRGRRRKQLLDDLKEREYTGTWKKRHIAGVRKSIWKRLWT